MNNDSEKNQTNRRKGKKKHNREKGKPLYLTLFLTAGHRATTVAVALFHPLRSSLSHDSLPSLRDQEPPTAKPPPSPETERELRSEKE
ncbi:D-alanyl-D-alanine carboxypeptidase/D-alanyl-D-alanine-endopeptidase [Sesbania bispinosa]|nr:D-alanyl-D-alanine carboxypeptidase/D-alanyl-D-alanine-endopeptidase [Sesbania bispinosa]